jgi:hypothetical protein
VSSTPSVWRRRFGPRRGRHRHLRATCCGDDILKDLNHSSEAFSNAEAVARYAQDPPRKVPGFGDLHRMATLLLEERSPEDAGILVSGQAAGWN